MKLLNSFNPGIASGSRGMVSAGSIISSVFSDKRGYPKFK